MHAAAAAAKSLQSCPTLCYCIDGSPPGSPIPGILQARILEWVAISFSNVWKWKVKVKVKSCPTLRDPVDCSLPGSSVYGIFHARVLEWGAIAFSKTLNVHMCFLNLNFIHTVFCLFSVNICIMSHLSVILYFTSVYARCRNGWRFGPLQFISITYF